MSAPLSIEDAKRAFEASIRAELADIESSIRSLLTRFDSLADHGRGVNGLAPAAKGWKREAEVLADKIRAEADDVSKALLGTGPERVETVNEEHAGRVIAAKGAA